MSPKQYAKHQERKWQRSLRASGMSSGGYRKSYKQKTSYWNRLDKVRDPKSAFRYLMDNVAGNNSGKLLSDFASRGEYYWVERDRSADQSYYIVRKRGNYVVVTQRKWVVNGQGVNTFIGGLVGFESEPVCVDTVILRHPIMEVETFQAAYAKAAPALGFWLD
jgi:hypothetical protein